MDVVVLRELSLHSKYFDDKYVLKVKRNRGRHVEEVISLYFCSKLDWLQAFYWVKDLLEGIGYSLDEVIDEHCSRELGLSFRSDNATGLPNGYRNLNLEELGDEPI
jgi:hypothetical protein